MIVTILFIVFFISFIALHIHNKVCHKVPDFQVTIVILYTLLCFAISIIAFNLVR
jgi:hypothetical protein